jgi:hypothetical protein
MENREFWSSWNGGQGCKQRQKLKENKRDRTERMPRERQMEQV